MSKIEKLSESIPEAFEALLFEDSKTTGVKLHYHSASQLDIEGLLEELPPYVKIDWHGATSYSNDGKSYEKAPDREFDFFKLLDPRLMLNPKILEIIRIRDIPIIKGQLISGRYNVASMDLPSDLILWLKEKGQLTRSTVFMIDDQPMVRLMSQYDIPPSRAIVSLFFKRPSEEVNTLLLCSYLLLAASEIRGLSSFEQF